MRTTTERLARKLSDPQHLPLARSEFEWRGARAMAAVHGR